MAYLLNESSNFADEFVAGLAAAYPARVREVSGGLVRRIPTRDGHVAVVIGGGSGHYPAFGGLVGDGLAHGAALGNLFASPSARQVHSVATAAAAGGGVMFCFGNYAGDVLNFRQAAAKLAADGIDSKILAVTDDVSSADAEHREQRRGVAGGLVVYKVASAAADAGLELAEVERLAARANDRVRTLGVAFSGCTLPGATEPLFTVPQGRMAVGMGIHGEQGISEIDVPTADALAELLIARLVEERPNDGVRAVVLLNGLGAVKYEELFVVYRRVAELLREAGVVVVDAEVGELVTSFEMAGVSLSIFWLDDELERLWIAPADAPAFRTGSRAASMLSSSADTRAQQTAPRREAAEATAPAESSGRTEEHGVTEAHGRTEATEASRASARVVMDGLEALHAAILASADELGRLDAVAGDGDHGIGMERGATAGVAAARAALAAGRGAGSVLTAASEAWSDRAGGTSGVLWGLLLAGLGTALGDEDPASSAAVAGGVRTGADAIALFGGAQLGDKTMLDALFPFADALDLGVARGLCLAEAWDAASGIATTSAAATADFAARTGRARSHGDHSVGTPDPGAVSFALIVTAVGEVLRAGHDTSTHSQHRKGVR